MSTMRRNRLNQGGFTLVELMVSLVAGLIVAMAVVLLSKSATDTFHEEGRTAGAETGLRMAVERLRNDLARAAYMSTANIQADPLIAHAPGAPNVPDNTTYPGISALAGVQLYQNGSLLKTTGLSTVNALSPDKIDIGGNFTSTEGFVVRSIDTGGACAGQRLTLEMDTPAMWRVRGTPSPDETLRTMFQPVANDQFIVRVQDDTGHFQYVPTCSGVATAQVTAGGVAYVDVANTGAFHILSAKETQTNGGATGLGVGRLVVNPVQIVRWEVRPIDTSANGDLAYAALQPPVADGGTTDKYDLFRGYINAKGLPAGIGAAGQAGPTELVAEYAVDLKFGFSADLGAATTTPRVLTVYGLSDARNATIAAANTVVGAQPQRIRSVRFRLSTRAAVADRVADLQAPAANAQQGAYPLRYCIVAAGCTVGQPGWARMRTVTSEVLLGNQASLFY